MSQALSNPVRLSLISIIKLSIGILIVVGIAGALYFQRAQPMEVAISHVEESLADETADRAGLVMLTPEKLLAGELTAEVVERHLIQPELTVPGRLLYDETRHIAIKAPISGILAELPVKPGDKVSKGDLLAVVNSAEIGRARSEILRRQADMELATAERDRMKEISVNLEDLLKVIEQKTKIDQIESLFSDKSLGDYRQRILSGYSRYLLAFELMEKVQPMAQSGAIATRQVREWESDVQVTRSEFRSACDQSRYDAAQSKRSAESNLAEAERQLKIAQEELRTLMGSASELEAEFSRASLSSLEIRAPFEGTIESLALARNERLSVTDSICVLADTTSLYVSADIRENDWQAVEMTSGTEIQVTSSALPDEQMMARIHYIGREVSTTANAVPLIATIDNSDGQLRPGMFVRVSLPVGKSREALAIHPESIVQHDNKKFVFVEMGERLFNRVDIKTGIESREWVEITDGLKAGQKVVRNGAFILKSELLLEGEE
ncbi:Cobalt-zinc-cadmium resistance protein CzcB [Polystyrenella longa]|uniref:Cobalt-zinc-cadmium resistance protein CzcB n=1 Tax=Polystyrenella longa TaxID=2528007 RepID=A0A518CTN5_9PLAN|nr:efflux RND transporter periplasmic adaptor subunit [Polystyrenella longa]QDU82573.1 Cobalt-zinc-cadmium resistance protein CzcB [Polystyrenella longa]